MTTEYTTRRSHHVLATRTHRFCRSDQLVGQHLPLRFVDLFSGIGGFHLAFDNVGARCVFAAENDPYARRTYVSNFTDKTPSLFEDGRFAEDVTDIDVDEIPDFDVLCAGFPCQPFSLVGRRQGFADARGTLFFQIMRIIAAKQPTAFFLENVQGLLSHHAGATFETMRKHIKEDLGYSLHYKVVRACDFGLPQLRPRLFMIGFRDPDTPFQFPEAVPLQSTMSDIMRGECQRDIGRTILVGGRAHRLNDPRNWDGYIVDGKERRLSVREAAAMQGFPSDFMFPVSTTQAMKQLGNAVAVAPIEATARALVRAIRAHQPLPRHHDAQRSSRTHSTNKPTTHPTRFDLHQRINASALQSEPSMRCLLNGTTSLVDDLEAQSLRIEAKAPQVARHLRTTAQQLADIATASIETWPQATG